MYNEGDGDLEHDFHDSEGYLGSLTWTDMGDVREG